jgi:F-type H+-transporting ATPase subunit gamma
MTVAEVEKRLGSARVVEGIVTTMRTLSAVQLRHGSEALKEIREFEAVLREALASIETPALQPASPIRLMMVVIGSDQGMCGALTRQIVERAVARREHLGERAGDVVAVGLRAYDHLRRAGIEVKKVHGAPTSIAGVERLVERIGRTVQTGVAEGEHDGVEVAYTQHVGTGAGMPAVTRVFPIDRERLLSGGRRAEAPGHVRLFEKPSEVARAVYDLWTISETYRAAVEALTSEHAARLRTTDAAHRAVEKRIEALIVERNRLRQDQITEELQEIVAGTDALR